MSKVLYVFIYDICLEGIIFSKESTGWKICPATEVSVLKSDYCFQIVSYIYYYLGPITPSLGNRRR